VLRLRATDPDTVPLALAVSPPLLLPVAGALSKCPVWPGYPWVARGQVVETGACRDNVQTMPLGRTLYKRKATSLS